MVEQRPCKCCGESKPSGEFLYSRGKQCRTCYRAKNAAKHRRLQATSQKYREGKNAYIRQYRKKHRRTKKWLNEYQRDYMKTPNGRRIAMKSLYKFIENHPEYDFDYIWRFIQWNEWGLGNRLSLDKRFLLGARKSVSLGDIISFEGKNSKNKIVQKF